MSATMTLEEIELSPAGEGRLTDAAKRTISLTSQSKPNNGDRLGTGQHTPISADEQNEAVEGGRVRIVALMIALCLSLFIAALDQTIVATSLPIIASRLNSASGYTWVGGAYLLASAAAAPIWTKASDIWGRKPILLAAVLLFFLSSIVCAAAVDMNMLIAGRALQGTAGGGLLQLVMVVVADLFSVRERGLYIGILEFMWTISGGLGPILGGVFSEYVSWRWNFWINLPICAIAFLLLFFYLDVHNPQTPMIDGLKAIDWLGSASILGFTLMVLLGLNFGGEVFPWDSANVICLLVFGALCIGVFYYGEKYVAKYPLMPLELLKDRSVVATLLVTLFHGAVFIACEYYLPLYFQSAQRSTPMHSGLLILPFVIAEGIFSGISGFLIHRTGKYLGQIWLGTGLLCLGTGLFIRLNPHSSLAELVFLQVVAGAGSALLFAPPLIALQATVKQEDTASATGMLGFIRTLAMSISIVVGGVVFQNSMARERDALERAGIAEALVEKLTGSSAAASTELIREIHSPVMVEALASAFSGSLRNVWIMYTAMAGIAVVASAFIRDRTLNVEHTETRTGIKQE